LSKKPNSALNYAPRRPQAIAAANQRPLERATQGVVQRQQRYPIFEVTAGGKSIEWTDMRATAHAVFAGAHTLPKQLSMVYENGRRVLLDELNQVGSRPAQNQLAVAA
jgi:hypothetical protein